MALVRPLLGVLILLALAATGFAHQPPNAGLERFIAAGGDRSAICADTGRTGHLHDAGPCDACRLVGAAVLPPLTAAMTRTPKTWAVRARVALGFLPVRPRDPAIGPRAPPPVA
ncbi:hypothetical protein [Oceaniglobus indicus]|uniref:hypothetical protein n=1 Tax=Oceaniglobus indicus TaxID=2047749 RepID=UPI000C17731D|nr:hypothetical protein [Oceaniglobus indicus]